MGGSPKPGTTATTHTTTTTTTTRPVATTTGIGLKTVTWTDTIPAAGLVVNPAPGGSAGPRALVTEIWYPSLGGSKTHPTVRQRPDYAAGPYPVIVFAHGFDTLPATYTALLSSWVDAGFVVVAPLFPDENANKISSLGAATTEQLELAESDVVNEPYDIAYVVGEVESGASGSRLERGALAEGARRTRKVRPRRPLRRRPGRRGPRLLRAPPSYATHLRRTFDATVRGPHPVGLGAVGHLRGPLGRPVDAVRAKRRRPVQPAEDAATLVHDAGGGFFLKLLGAGHFAPYVGQGPAAPIVEKVTAAFLKDAVAGTPRSRSCRRCLTGSRLRRCLPALPSPRCCTTLQPTPAERACAPAQPP